MPKFIYEIDFFWFSYIFLAFSHNSTNFARKMWYYVSDISNDKFINLLMIFWEFFEFRRIKWIFCLYIWMDYQTHSNPTSGPCHGLRWTARTLRPDSCPQRRQGSFPRIWHTCPRRPSWRRLRSCLPPAQP